MGRGRSYPALKFYNLQKLMPLKTPPQAWLLGSLPARDLPTYRSYYHQGRSELWCLQSIIIPSWLPGGSVVKNLACQARDAGSIPGLGPSIGEGNGNSLQYSCLGNSWTEEPGRLQSMGLQRISTTIAPKQQHNSF